MRVSVILAADMKKEYSTRASFSLPPQLLKELGEVTKVMGYGERSRTIQMAIRNLITESKLSANDEALAIGAIIVLAIHQLGHIRSQERLMRNAPAPTQAAA